MNRLQWIERKILSLPELKKRCEAQRLTGKRIVFTNGCFDILHRGHLSLLSQAADQGDFLIVGINSDASVKRLKGEQRPVNSGNDRAFQLASLLCVDAVCFFEEDTPLQLVKELLPDVLVKGGDYTKENIVGATEVESNGGVVCIIPFVQGYSTTGLIEKIIRL